jgi:hypothetical protein
MRTRPLFAAIAAALVLAAGALRADVPPKATGGPVDLLLVLAADVSRSVDDAEFHLQREGYATALTDPRVLQAIASGPNRRIALTYMEWSGVSAQATIVEWTQIAGPEDAQRVAGQLRTAPRLFRDRTAIGAAIERAVVDAEQSPFTAERRVIDISGDGTNTGGRDVAAARDEAVAKGFTVNALVILSDVPLAWNPNHTHPPGGLTAYFENNVIGGPGAFAVAADGFEAFGRAILAKLIREIASLDEPAAARVR